MTYQELLQYGTASLIEAEIPEADLDARYLFEAATGMNRGVYYIHIKEQASCEEEKAYQSFLALRKRRIPVQRILGTQEFMGLTFYCQEDLKVVSPDALIPRQETELLTQMALEYVKALKRDARILDLCTGTGCIPISILKLCKEKDEKSNARESCVIEGQKSRIVEEQKSRIVEEQESCVIEGQKSRIVEEQENDSMDAPGYHVTGVACDLSEKALEVARRNRLLHDLTEQDLTLIKSDLFHNIPEEKFDLITANPPYIPSKEVEKLEPEVRNYDPILALDGGEDGLDLYRILIPQAKQYLRKGGTILLEIGYDQGKAVEALLLDAGYLDVKILKDLAGLDRILQARR